MPHPWNIQGQLGQSSEKSDVVEGVPQQEDDLDWMTLDYTTFKGPFQYKPFYDPMKIREFNIFFHLKNLHIFHKHRKWIIDQYFDYTDAKQQHSHILRMYS